MINVEMLRILLIALSAVLLTGCGGGTAGGSSDGPVEKGGRILGMDINEVPTVTYDRAYEKAMDLGVEEVSISLDWSELEPSVGVYEDILPDTIEAFYAARRGSITLVLRPLDTAGVRVPAELEGLPFDDERVITAFRNFLGHLRGRLPRLTESGKLKWMHVGNEIDACLGSDEAQWSRWEVFFTAARETIHSLWGTDVAVGSVVQFAALRDAGVKTSYLDFLPLSDVAVLTYYPLKADFSVRPLTTVGYDFDLIVDTVGHLPVLIQECGFPTSSVNASSEALQADFISTVFRAWDKYCEKIQLVDFAWQHDISEAQASALVIAYNMEGSPYENQFKHYLWSLGLSRHDGSEKNAMQRLRDALRQRAWNQ